MGEKMVHIAGLAFALVFVAIFAFMWGTGRDLLGMSTKEAQDLYTTGYSFDVSVFDGTLVTGRSMKNLQVELDAIGNANSFKVDIEPTVDSLEDKKVYRSILEYNANGLIESIRLEAVV